MSCAGCGCCCCCCIEDHRECSDDRTMWTASAAVTMMASRMCSVSLWANNGLNNKIMLLRFDGGSARELASTRHQTHASKFFNFYSTRETGEREVRVRERWRERTNVVVVLHKIQRNTIPSQLYMRVQHRLSLPHSTYGSFLFSFLFASLSVRLCCILCFNFCCRATIKMMEDEGRKEEEIIRYTKDGGHCAQFVLARLLLAHKHFTIFFFSFFLLLLLSLCF